MKQAQPKMPATTEDLHLVLLQRGYRQAFADTWCVVPGRGVAMRLPRPELRDTGVAYLDVFKEALESIGLSGGRIEGVRLRFSGFPTAGQPQGGWHVVLNDFMYGASWALLYTTTVVGRGHGKQT